MDDVVSSGDVAAGEAEGTDRLCQLCWLDDALSPLSALENTLRFAKRRALGLRRRAARLASRLRASRRAGGALPRAPVDLPPPGGGSLRAGDLVIVLPVGEIRKTLDADGKHGGLKFLRPMEAHAGKTYRVMKRVRYILDDRDHVIRKVRNVVLLEGVVCEGRGIYGREDCDRSCFFFWKEAWLRKVGDAPQPSP